MYVLKDGTDWSPRFAVYGDLGYQNGDHSIPLLTKETNDRHWDVVLHVGECLPVCIITILRHVLQHIRMLFIELGNALPMPIY